MPKTFAQEHPFAFSVLRCIDEDERQSVTLEEIHEEYSKKHPRLVHFINKTLTTNTLPRMKLMVDALFQTGYLEKSLTSFTNQVVEKDTPVYRISNTGKSALLEEERRRSSTLFRLIG